MAGYVRLVLAHHGCGEACGALIPLIRVLRASLGLDVVEAGLADLPRVLSKGDVVYGVLAFEAGHVSRDILPHIRARGAEWRGVVPAWAIASILGRSAARLGAERILVVAHPSRGFRERQERKLGLICRLLGSRGGVEASYAFHPISKSWPPTLLVAPLAFFRGRFWRSVCRVAADMGASCSPPLLEEGYDVIASWIASCESPRL